MSLNDRTEMIHNPHGTIPIAILVPRFNIFNMIHFEEETNQTTEENKYGSQGKSHAAILI